MHNERHHAHPLEHVVARVVHVHGASLVVEFYQTALVVVEQHIAEQNSWRGGRRLCWIYINLPLLDIFSH